MTNLVKYVQRHQLPGHLRRKVNDFLLITDAQEGREDVDPMDRPLVRFDPDAAANAEAMLGDRRPASPDVIGQWLTDLADATVPVERDVKMRRVAMAVRLLGNLPAFCWNEDTFMAAASVFKHYPTVAELSALLKPIADRHEREMHHLEAMGRAPRPLFARESATPYPVQPVPSDQGRQDMRDRIPRPDLDKKFKAPKQFVDEHVERARAALAEVRAKRGGGGES